METCTLCLQLLFQRLIVFNDAVVHQHTALERCGWAFCSEGFSCVAHRVWLIPTVPLEFFLPERFLKIGQFADTTPDFKSCHLATPRHLLSRNLDTSNLASPPIRIGTAS